MARPARQRSTTHVAVLLVALAVAAVPGVAADGPRTLVSVLAVDAVEGCAVVRCGESPATVVRPGERLGCLGATLSRVLRDRVTVELDSEEAAGAPRAWIHLLGGDEEGSRIEPLAPHPPTAPQHLEAPSPVGLATKSNLRTEAHDDTPNPRVDLESRPGTTSEERQ